VNATSLRALREDERGTATERSGADCRVGIGLAVIRVVASVSHRSDYRFVTQSYRAVARALQDTERPTTLEGLRAIADHEVLVTNNAAQVYASGDSNRGEREEGERGGAPRLDVHSARALME